MKTQCLPTFGALRSLLNALAVRDEHPAHAHFITGIIPPKYVRLSWIAPRAAQVDFFRRQDRDRFLEVILPLKIKIPAGQIDKWLHVPMIFHARLLLRDLGIDTLGSTICWCYLDSIPDAELAGIQCLPS